MQTQESPGSLADVVLQDQWLREAMLSAPVPLAVIAEDGRFLLLSRAWCELSGYSPQDIPSLFEWTERAYGPRKEEVRAWIDEVFALNRRLEEGEFVIRTGSGQQRVWEFNSSPVGRLSDGRKAILTIARDVTESSAALRELRHTQASAQETLRAARAGTWEWDLPADRLTFSESCLSILGRMELSSGAEQWLLRIDEADRQVLRAAVQQVIEGRANHLDVAVHLSGADETHRRLRLLGGCTRRDQGAAIRLGGLVLDAPQTPAGTESFSAAPATDRWTMELEERDRRRIAEELHRGLGQQLAGLAMVGKALQKKLDTDGSVHSQDAEFLVRHLLAAHRHARRLARGLAPVSAEPDGLPNALAELARRCSDLHRVGCTFSCETPIALRDPLVASHLYHIAQEAVHNAVRHGRPRRILVSLAQPGPELVLDIRDDGRGLPDSSPPDQAQGWKLMHHRARAIGGSLEIQPGPTGGVILTCRVPVPES